MKKKVKVYLKKNGVNIFIVVAVLALLFIVFQDKVASMFERSSKPVQSEQMYAPETSREELAPQHESINQQIPSDGLLFCFRLDGQENKHLPALMGNQSQGVYDNGISGTNWKLAPVATGSEDYGVLPDGRVFAKAKFLELWGMQSYVEIKSDKTGWQAVRMEEVKLDGELAYIY